jgi:hypothetical protein
VRWEPAPPLVLKTPKQILRDLFSIDPRSLALMRVLLGLYLLVDLAMRAGDLEAFASDAGVLPRARFIAPGSLRWSLHALGGSVGFEAALFVLAAVVAVALLVGWHARLAAVASWILIVSLHNRSDAILISGDKAIRLILFWSLFLPLGARGGLDARRRDPKADGEPIASLAAAALLVQVISIYPATVIRKLEHGPWRDLSVVSRLLAVDGVTSPLGRLFRLVPEVHPILTALTLVIEIVLPILALASFSKGRVRTFAALGMIVFHLLALGSMLMLGLFPLVMTVAWSVFLPPWFWDEALPRARRSIERTIPILGRGLDGVVAWVAWLERTAGVEVRSSRARSASPVETALVAGAAALVLVDGALSLRARGVEPPTHPAIELLRLDQDWELYVAVMTNRYHVYAAKLADGSWVDLHRDGAPLDWDRPRNRPENNRWWKYLLHVVDYPDTFAPSLSAYLARRWNAAHPERRVESIDIVMVERPFELAADAPSRRVSIWHEELGDGVPAASIERRSEPWKIGDRVAVDVVLGPGHLASACSSEVEVAGDRCAFAPSGRSPQEVDASQVLQPFARAAGPPILAASDALEERRDAAGRAACTFEVGGKVLHPRVRWSDDGSWFATRTVWFAGRLVDCKRAPAEP